MLHERRRRAHRHPGDLAARADRIPIQRRRDALQPAADDRGFLEHAAPRWRRLRLYRRDARILSLRGLPSPQAAEGKSRLTIVSSFGERLLAAAIFLALEVPLGVIAYRVTRRIKPFLVPAGLLVAAVLLPDLAWGGLLLLIGLFTMFGQAISARVRKTTAEERRQLAARGPSPWLGQSRRSSLSLIAVGVVAMTVGIAADGPGPSTALTATLFFYAGSIMLGIGLFRRHTVLVHYLGRRRARWLEVLQISTAFVAYGLATAGEFSPDPGRRLAFRLLSFIPFGLHFLFVWIPLMKAQERPVLAETPFA